MKALSSFFNHTRHGRSGSKGSVVGALCAAALVAAVSLSLPGSAQDPAPGPFTNGFESGGFAPWEGLFKADSVTVVGTEGQLNSFVNLPLAEEIPPELSGLEFLLLQDRLDQLKKGSKTSAKIFRSL